MGNSTNNYAPVEENGMIPQFDGYFGLSCSLEEAGRGTLKLYIEKRSNRNVYATMIKKTIFLGRGITPAC